MKEYKIWFSITLPCFVTHLLSQTSFLKKHFKTSCNYNGIIVVVSFSGQWKFFWKNIFSSAFQSSKSKIFCQGVWVLPTSFLYLSAHGFSMKMRECIDKCYACCQRSCRKHSLQKTDCVYTQAMLALNRIRLRASIYFFGF